MYSFIFLCMKILLNTMNKLIISCYTNVFKYFLLIFLLSRLYSQPAEPLHDALKDSKAIEIFDSLTQSKFFHNLVFRNDFSSKNCYSNTESYIHDYNDSILINRIVQLNANSPINFTYNEDVKAHIIFYLRRSNYLSKLMGLSRLYFPLFEEILDKYDLPKELKYLPIIESALNPHARSRAGAMGLWQFMYRTGLVYGLEVSNYVDDRCDPLKATEAACKHLLDLYHIYNDWLLALAAYNAGAAKINRAIKLAGFADYWQIRNFLPRETQRYVPSFIAVTYIFSYHCEHNIEPLIPIIVDAQIDTVTVRGELSFDVISELLSVPIEILELLNPAYKKQIIPASFDEKRYVLRLPSNKILEFYKNELDLYYLTLARRYPHIMSDYVTLSGMTIYNKPYKIKCDTCVVSNGVNDDSIKILTPINSFDDFRNVFIALTTSSNIQTNVSLSAQSKSNVNTRYLHHIVRSGETLGGIANKYNLSVKELMALNNLTKHTIYPGQKLIVSTRPSISTNTNKSIQTSSNKLSFSESSSKIHIVRSGDTLWSIAQKYGITVNKIMNDNNLKTDKLYIGQQLKIVK